MEDADRPTLWILMVRSKVKAWRMTKVRSKVKLRRKVTAGLEVPGIYLVTEQCNELERVLGC